MTASTPEEMTGTHMEFLPSLLASHSRNYINELCRILLFSSYIITHLYTGPTDVLASWDQIAAWQGKATLIAQTGSKAFFTVDWTGSKSKINGAFSFLFILAPPAVALLALTSHPDSHFT